MFDFTVSRHRDGPDQFLIDSQFSGTLLADCYSAYEGITLRCDTRIIRADCHAHTRRKLFDAQDNHPLLASQFLTLYQQLYGVEDRARGLSAADRQALRNDLDVYAFLKAVLDVLLSDSTNYAALRPDRWAAAHPEAIRVYRQTERRERYARKTARRAKRRLAATDSP